MNYEKWVVIADYPDYAVSDWGRVKRVKAAVKYGSHAKVGHFLTPVDDWKGYLQVTLSKDNRGKTFRVHRLVAIAFVENKNCKNCVNHIDNNPFNNAATNLEWVTPAENTNHALKQDRLHRKAIIRSHPECHDVLYPSISSVEFDGFSKSSVFKCAVGLNKKHQGFTWRYA